ncbi:hypothetical protein VXE65_19360 [Mycolicibacterium conceptionense]|uniref:hypothetical protein n=1 Tax=Mycolicibacterium conceptionense TaxID=451644 RepID=UPI003204EB63
MSIKDMWNNTQHHRSVWIGGAVAVVLVVAVFLYGLVSMVAAGVRWASAEPAKPDPMTQWTQRESDSGLVQMFATDCVERWAKSTPEMMDSLSDCFTIAPEARQGSPMAATVTGVFPYTPQLTYKNDEVSLWSVLVGFYIKEAGDDAATHQYTQLLVSLPRSGGPRAMLMPATTATALPPGSDMELAYNHEVRGTMNGAGGRQDPAPLYGVVQDFMTAYLVGPPDKVSSFATPESGLTGLGQLFYEIKIESVKADTAADGPPLPGEQVHVLVTVTGKKAGGGIKPMQYPLLVVDSGGRWAVSAIENMPAITGRMLTPGG